LTGVKVLGACIILIGLFALQRYGTNKVNFFTWWTFEPNKVASFYTQVSMPYIDSKIGRLLPNKLKANQRKWEKEHGD